MNFLAFNIAPLQALPDGLMPRFDSGSTMIGVLLFTAFITIALVRVSQSGAYASLIVANGKMQGLSTFIKESMPLDKLSSILLLVNYLLSGSAMLYLFAIQKDYNGTTIWWIVGLLPLLLFGFTLLSLYLTRVLVGEENVFQEPILFKVIGTQLIGLVYFCLAIAWMFNTNYSTVFINLMIFTFIIESSIRIIKSVLLVSSKHVPVYYIILYFCTLEILPVSIACYVIIGGFD
jgi:hypothetical protein